MKNLILFIVIIAVAAYVFLVIKKNRESAQPATIEKSVVLTPGEQKPEPKEPPVRNPAAEPDMKPVADITVEPQPEPLPALDESDNAILQALSSLAAGVGWRDVFLFESIVRHFVVTVDNMTALKLPRKYRFVQPLPGTFLVRKGGDETLFINTGNYGRYEAYIRLAETIDLEQLVSLYRRYYPLFQQAYEELGYPGRYFNDRLVEVVDHLLQAPEIPDPIELKQPKVFYTFADAELENLSAGRKLMVRMGRENSVRVKARLRALRELLTKNQ